MIENQGRNFFDGCAEGTKRKILEAALDEFALHSPEGARSRTIAQKAGVNHAGLCYHFGSKDGIYLEIIKMAVDKFKADNSEFFKRTDDLFSQKKPSAEAAKDLVKDILLSQMSLIFNNPVAGKMFMIVRREEMYPTAGYDLLYEGILNPLYSRLAKLVNIARGGKLSCAEAGISANLLFGLVGCFLTIGETVARMSSNTHFHAEKLVLSKKILSENLDKIFNS